MPPTPHSTTRFSGEAPRHQGNASPAPQERTVGDSQKHRSPFFCLISPPVQKRRDRSCLSRSLRVGRRPEGAAGASLNGRTLPPPPRMPGINGRARRVRAQHPCEHHLPSPAGASTLTALPQNTYLKASNFTRAPKGGETSPQAGLRPVHIPPGVPRQAPAPRSPPRSAPRTTPWAGREGETAISRAIKHRWYFPCSIKT